MWRRICDLRLSSHRWLLVFISVPRLVGLCLHLHVGFSLGVPVCAPVSSSYEDTGLLTDLISLDYPCEDPMCEEGPF